MVVDAVITDSTCFQELHRYREAIVGNSSQPVRDCLKLVFNRLDLLGLAVGQLNLFLNMVDPNRLIGLSLASNDLNADGLKQLAPVLLKFRALQALDLSQNAINFSSSTENCEVLGAILRRLPNLKRFSLAGNPLGPRLRRIFRSVQPKFIYLSLAAGTALTAVDLNDCRNDQISKIASFFTHL